MSDPKERMWRDVEDAQMDAARRDGCLSTGEWIAVIILTFVFAVLIWKAM